ncbi:hypothetical protein JXA88_14795 [Candidatus Fermentibacteria bacterium]|nr:hypothetical protein [Candidatus Fermentibacteria bacterium]
MASLAAPEGTWGIRGGATTLAWTVAWGEHEVFTAKYKVSTVKVLELAVAQGKGVYDIDEGNLEEQLALMDLPSWAEDQIRDHVEGGYKAKAPPHSWRRPHQAMDERVTVRTTRLPRLSAEPDRSGSHRRSCSLPGAHVDSKKHGRGAR